MLISMLKSKIAYAKITQKELFYVGSISLDPALMDRAQLRENEKVHIVNLNNGERLETYVTKAQPIVASSASMAPPPAKQKSAMKFLFFLMP